MFHLRKILSGEILNSLRNNSQTYSAIASVVPIEIGYTQGTLSNNITHSYQEKFCNYSHFTNTITPKIVEVDPHDGFQNIF